MRCELFFITAHGHKVTRGPSNVVTKVGQNFTLLCAGYDLEWLRIVTFPKDRIIMLTSERHKYKLEYHTIMYGRCLSEGCTLNKGNRKYDLVVKSAVLGDSGRYRCNPRYNTRLDFKEAEVIIFGKLF